MPNDDTFRAVVEELHHSLAANQPGWVVQHLPQADIAWLQLRHEYAAPPEQGWKLHVSAAAAAAEQVLRRVLPILFAEHASFKIVAAPPMLAALNHGRHGLSQVGKFITIYPNDDRQAVRLAVAIDQATRGLAGPDVPSDRPLAPGGLVHYRYGGFRARLMQTPVGEVVSAIRDPSGALVPDPRLPEYRPPEWAEDPFLAAGVTAPLPPPTMCAERYCRLGRLHRTARGEVDLALDITTLRLCVLKRANRDAEPSSQGLGAGGLLRREAEILRRLGPSERFPAAYDSFEVAGNTYLCMEDIAGETLEMHLRREALLGRLMEPAQIAACGRQLARLLAELHDTGIVHRDLQARNIIVTPGGELRLVDFEMAHDLRDASRAVGGGTRGYMSPQQAAQGAPAITDDIYSLGAVLYFMATSAGPAFAPRPFALLDRPLALMNPETALPLAPVITRCLAPDPAARFQSAGEVDAALAAIAPAPQPGTQSEPLNDEAAPEPWRELARRAAEAVCAFARPTPDGKGRAWASRHHSARGWAHRGLNLGTAGTLMALAELFAAFGEPAHGALVGEAARWLLRVPRLDGAPAAGLYVGEAAIGAALLRAGQVLDDDALIAAALERGAWIASLPHGSLDIFNGTAGRVRFHLLLWDETGDDAQLCAALEAAERLLAAATSDREGETRWITSGGDRAARPLALVGYAHGAAGIADVFLDLLEVTGDRRFAAPALGVTRWLGRLALPALRDGSGLEWPDLEEGGKPSGGTWCHGAAGIGHFLAQAIRLGVAPDAARLAVAAARTVAQGCRWASPVQCHGLAGHIEFLLDLFQATGDRAHLAAARSMARVLAACAVERDGALVWPSDDPETFSPDYTVGFGGVAVCLLRLAEAERAPRQLSRRGFRYRTAPGGGSAGWKRLANPGTPVPGCLRSPSRS